MELNPGQFRKTNLLEAVRLETGTGIQAYDLKHITKAIMERLGLKCVRMA